MRITIVIDEELIEELMRIERGVSRSEAIRRAVQDYINRKRMSEFMSLADSSLIDLDWREPERMELEMVKHRDRRP